MSGEMLSTAASDQRGGWQEIGALADDLARLARSCASRREFYLELLRGMQNATAAAGCAVWTVDDRQQPRLECETWADASASGDREPLASRGGALTHLLRDRDSVIVPPRASSEDGPANATAYTLVAQTIRIDAEPHAILELLLAPDLAPTELRNVQQLVAIFADIAGDFQRNWLLRELRQRESSWSELNRYAESVHRGLDLRQTCYVVANEAVRVADCDRASIVLGADAGWRVAAISGIDSPDRRSSQILALRELAKAVTRSGEPLWYAADSEGLAPQVATKLQGYLDAAHTRAVAVVPLHHEPNLEPSAGEPPGVLIFENFEAQPWSDAKRQRVQLLASHAASAVSNATELTQLPLASVSRWIQRLTAPFHARSLPRTAWVLLGIAAVAGLLAIPVDFDLHAEGELQPVERRHVFAPADGTIDEIRVGHGDVVTAGQPLVILRSSDLDYELSRVRGELQTSRQRQQAVRNALLTSSREQPSPRYDEQTAEEARLAMQIASLQEQQQLLEQQQDELTVRSALDGQVLTWDVGDLLQSRPVRRGQRLLTVADLDGSWDLELGVRDHDVAHLLDAKQQQLELPVSFVLSHPGETWRGRIRETALATQIDDDHLPSLQVHVTVDEGQLPSARPGATAFARIHCGRRPLGYVWFRQLWEVVRTRWLFGGSL